VSTIFIVHLVAIAPNEIEPRRSVPGFHFVGAPIGQLQDCSQGGGDAAPDPNYIVRQSTLSSRSSQNRSKATLTFADYNLVDFAGHQNLGSLRSRLARYGNTFGRSIGQNGTFMINGVVINRDWSAARLVDVRFTANSGHVQYN
jgi:hypothetical protein